MLQHQSDMIGNHADTAFEIFCGSSPRTDHMADLEAPLKSLQWRSSETNSR